MITKITKIKLFLFMIAAMLLFSACGYEGSVTIITSLPSPSPSLSPSATPTQTEKPSPSPTEAPSPSPTVTPDPLDAYIAQMSDKELVGQLLMMGFSGTNSMPSDSYKLMNKYSVGNFMLFGKQNTVTFSQTKSLIKNIKSHNKSKIPLLIAIDLEGGRVTRFPQQWHPYLKSARRLGDANDSKAVYKEYKRIGKQLKEIGFNINFAPVLDISQNLSSTFLGKSNRMFGSSPKKVSKLIKEAIHGLHDAGIASLGKHFPGHGDTTTDSHAKLPVIKTSLKDMEKYSLIPFKAAVDAGIDGMLVAHLSYPKVDSKYITSMSPTVINGLLREEMGFKGIVVSDDLRMRGFSSKYSISKGAVLHILAGGDMLLIGRYPDKQKTALDSLYNALKDGTLTRERVEQSVRRILELKMKYAGFKLEE